MEWRFFVESKSFLFSVKENDAVVRLEKRQKCFAGVVSLGLHCSVWLIATVEVALRNSGLKDFVKSFQEGEQVLIVLRAANRADCFLELAVYAEGGRQGLILLQEGCKGRGCSLFAGELCKAMDFLEASGA